MDWFYWDNGLVITCTVNGQAKKYWKPAVTFSFFCLTVLVLYSIWDHSREDEQREAVPEFSFIVISLDRFQNLSAPGRNHWLSCRSLNFKPFFNGKLREVGFSPRRVHVM